MSLLENTEALVMSLIVAPAVGAIFWAGREILDKTRSATNIQGDGELAQAQDSVHSGAETSLNLLEFASNLETLILFVLVLLGLLAYAQVNSGR